MNDSFLNKSDESVTNLLQKSDSLSLTELFVWMKILFKITIAYFLDNIIIVATLHDIKYFDDIL